MPRIELNLDKKLFTPKFYPYLQDYSHRWEFYMGSAGSGKSVFIHQKIIVRCLTQAGIRVLICRKTAESARETTFEECKNVLTSWKIIEYVQINKTDKTITFPNKSKIIFMGLDTETRLLSLSNISCVFVEEAFEVEENFIEQLNLRMRGQRRNQQLILAWNPISKNSWLYRFTVENPPANSIFIHSTYKDNPFLNEEYISAIEELETRNPAKWKVYGLGQWGVIDDGLVFRNWKVEEFDISSLSASGLEHRVGSDLGFIDPTTIIDTLYDRENKIIYVFNEFYKTGCQLDEVYLAMCGMQLGKTKIYMDAAEPRSIDFFRRKGMNTVPCLKGVDSVKARISFLQNHQIIVHPKCEHLIAEFENFSYKKDSKTGLYKDDDYTHEWSHCIDGLGYAYSDIYAQKKLKTMDKRILGL